MQIQQFEDAIPLYYAWFLNETSSKKLSFIGHELLKECLLHIPALTDVLLKHLHLSPSDIQDKSKFCNINWTISLDPFLLKVSFAKEVSSLATWALWHLESLILFWYHTLNDVIVPHNRVWSAYLHRNINWFFLLWFKGKWLAFPKINGHRFKHENTFRCFSD